MQTRPCFCGLETIDKVHLIDDVGRVAQIKYIHVCGIHKSGNHDHMGARLTIPEFVGITDIGNGLYEHSYKLYVVECNEVDNFVTAKYSVQVAYKHGHERRTPCHCYELGLE